MCLHAVSRYVLTKRRRRSRSGKRSGGSTPILARVRNSPPPPCFAELRFTRSSQTSVSWRGVNAGANMAGTGLIVLTWRQRQDLSPRLKRPPQPSNTSPLSCSSPTKLGRLERHRISCMVGSANGANSALEPIFATITFRLGQRPLRPRASRLMHFPNISKPMQLSSDRRVIAFSRQPQEAHQSPELQARWRIIEQTQDRFLNVELSKPSHSSCVFRIQCVALPNDPLPTVAVVPTVNQPKSTGSIGLQRPFHVERYETQP